MERAVSSESGLPGMARELGRLLDRPPTRILYISRIDLEPAAALAAAFPGAELRRLTKADLQGRGMLSILRQLRRWPVDLFVLHDRPVTMDRFRDLYRLAALLLRARRRFLLTADLHRGALTGDAILEEVRPGPTIPALVGGGVREFFLSTWNIARTPLALAAVAPATRAGALRDGPLDIAYLRTDYSVGIRAGGSVSHTAGVVSGLLRAGHRVRFLASDDVPDTDASVTPVDIVRPDPRIRLFDEAAMVAYHHRFVAEATRVLASRPPDLFYQRHSVFNASGAVLARRFRRPLVLEANHSEVEARAMWSRLFLRRLALAMERRAFAGADVIVAVSRIGAEALVRYGANPERVLVNPNGVDPERFRPEIDGAEIRRRYGIGVDDVVCGFIGTFTRWHGVLFLADAIPAVVERQPGARFLLMGDGDIRSNVADRLLRSGVSDRCVFTGLIPHHDVPAHLAACDILLSPHLPFEDGTPFFGSPTKLFEYLAMGKAVLASRLGQIGEVIEPGVSGILFEPGDMRDFVEALSALIGSRERRQELGAGARARVVREYTWQRNVERVLDFLRKRVAAGASAS